MLASATSCGGDGGTPPLPAVTSVSLMSSVEQLRIGQTTAVTATVLGANGAPLTRTVVYSSTAPTVASVSATGVVTALTAGVATITATADGRSGSVTLTVLAATASVSIDSASAVLLLGRTLRLTATARDAAGTAINGLEPRWTSAAPLVASVTSNGTVTALSNGVATLTATIDDRTATFTVTVISSQLTRLVLRPSAGYVPLGMEYAIRVSALDGDGLAVPTPAVTFASSASDVATVSPVGVVRGVKAGSATITATTAEGSASTVRFEVVPAFTMNGTVTTLDDSPATGLRFSAWIGGGTSAEQRFDVPVTGTTATGQFSITLPSLPPQSGTFDLAVDALAGGTRRFHPSFARLSAGVAPPTATTVLLVPHAIVIDSGTHVGRSVPISLNSAFTPVCTTAGEANCQSYWPSYWMSGIKMWPDAARPVPLALDRTGSGASLRAADSTSLWAIIRQMETDLGRRLYTPVNFTAYTSPGYQTGAVMVTVDPSLAASTAYANWDWNGQGMLYQGKVRFGSPAGLALQSLTAHELLHTQGFSHTCQWGTVMGGYGCSSVGQLSPNDVAYFHLAQLARRRTAELRPTWGIAEALAGERRLEMGIGGVLATTAPLPQHLERALLQAPKAGRDSSGHGTASSTSARAHQH